MDDNAAEQQAILAKYKQMPCRHCGVMMTVGAKQKKAPAHVECGIEIAIETARQMREKKGPYYERWRMSMTLALKKTEGGSPPINDEEG